MVKKSSPMQMQMKKLWKAYGGGETITDTELTNNWAAFKAALPTGKTITTIEWNATDAAALITKAAPSTLGTLTSLEIAAVPYEGTNTFTENEIDAAIIAVAAPATAAAVVATAAPATAATTVPITDITIDKDLLNNVTIPDGLTAIDVDTNQMLGKVKKTKAMMFPTPTIDVDEKKIKTQVADKIPATLSKDVTSSYSIGKDGTTLASTIASLMYAAEKLSKINEALQTETITGNKYISDTAYVLHYVNNAIPPSPLKDKLTDKVVNHIKASFLKHQAAILTEMTQLLQQFTAQAGGKKSKNSQRRFKGGFQEADMGKMYDVQGLISDLSASHDQNIITNPNVYPNPFSAGGLSQASEGIDANLSDSIKFDVVPSYNGGSKQKKVSRRK